MRKPFAFQLVVVALLAAACMPKTSQDQEAPEGSLAWIEQQIVANPGSAEAFARRARYFERIDSAALAEADWKRAIVLDSSSAQWRVALGDLYFRKIRLADAEKRFQEAIALDPEAIEPRSKLGEVYLMQNRFKEAMAVANDALRIDPLDGSIYNLKGWIHRLAGDTDLAISSYQTAVERDPALYDAYVSLGLLHAARHNDLAIAYYDNAIALQPSSVEALYNKAMFCQEHGRDSVALAIYARLKEIDPDYPVPYYNTGYILLEHLGRRGEARRAFSEAIERLPTYVQAYYSRGVTYELDGALDSALADYRMAIRLDPQHTDAALGLNRLADKGILVNPR
ncbi:MAG: tetratricopeptide repeat protein [Flavobacteriales bacterium]